MALKVVEVRLDGRLSYAELRCEQCGHPRYVRTAQDVQVLRNFAARLLELADALDRDRPSPTRLDAVGVSGPLGKVSLERTP